MISYSNVLYDTKNWRLQSLRDGLHCLMDDKLVGPDVPWRPLDRVHWSCTHALHHVTCKPKACPCNCYFPWRSVLCPRGGAARTVEVFFWRGPVAGAPRPLRARRCTRWCLLIAKTRTALRDGSQELDLGWIFVTDRYGTRSCPIWTLGFGRPESGLLRDSAQRRPILFFLRAEEGQQAAAGVGVPQRENARFRAPPATDLGGAEGLQDLLFPSGSDMRVVQGDVEYWFYQCGLTSWIREYSRLDSCLSGEECRSFGLLVDFEERSLDPPASGDASLRADVGAGGSSCWCSRPSERCR